MGKSGRCVRLTTLPPSCTVVMKSENFKFLEPLGPFQACNGTALPFSFTCISRMEFAVIGLRGLDSSQLFPEDLIIWDVTPCYFQIVTPVSALKMKALCSLETSETIHHSTPLNILEDMNLLSNDLYVTCSHRTTSGIFCPA